MSTYPQYQCSGWRAVMWPPIYCILVYLFLTVGITEIRAAINYFVKYIRKQEEFTTIFQTHWGISAFRFNCCEMDQCV